MKVKGYLTTRELHEALGINYHTVKQWIKRGHLVPDMRVGQGARTSPLFAVESLDRLREQIFTRQANQK